VPPAFHRKASVPAADLHRVGPLVARSRHADLVESAVAAESPVQTDREIILSWRRCIGDYHVDPRSGSTPHIITQTELTLFKEPVSDVLLHAREEIEPPLCHCPAMRITSFCCAIAKELPFKHRGDEAKAEEFKHWGIWLGGSLGPSKSRGRTELELRSLKTTAGFRPLRAAFFARATPT